jgi:hypothetical protein
MLRHIAWFSEAPVEPSPEGSLISPDATVGRRCLAPARAIEKLGVECSVFGNLCDADPVHVSKHLQKLNTDIVVIGKISGASMLKLAKAAKHLGCYVVADGGNAAAVSPEFAKLTEIADQTVAATPAVADAILKATGTKAVVIADCIEAIGHIPSADAVAKAWLECFKHLKMKPPACANTNVPIAH